MSLVEQPVITTEDNKPKTQTNTRTQTDKTIDTLLWIQSLGKNCQLMNSHAIGHPLRRPTAENGR